MFEVRSRTLVTSFVFVLSLPALAQNDLLSTMRVRVADRASLKAGSAVKAVTIEDFYVRNVLAVPRGTEVDGTVTDVRAVPKRQRLNAMSHGDFTPLRTPSVQFTELRFHDGHTMALDCDTASEASETVRFYARGTQHHSLLRQAWDTALGRKNAAVRAVTAPGKKDRIEDYVYEQLPWHPQEIEEGTVYELNLRHELTAEPAAPVNSTAKLNEQVVLRSRLVTPLNSKTAKQGDAVEAVVTAPAFDAKQQVEIPQGAMLLGHVVKTKTAKRFGRNGALRFTFDKLKLPEGAAQPVLGVAKAVDNHGSRELAIDSEGGVQESSNKSVLAPLALGLLATSALTEDEAPVTHAGVASNGFGLITRVVAIATKSNIFGGVMGGIATARMVYTRFLEHGHDVQFARGTGIEVDLGPSKVPMETRTK